MRKLVFCLLTMSSIAFGQIEKNVDDFNKVTFFDRIDVMLIPSDENKVILNGSGAENVELVNKNGELKIKMPLINDLAGDRIYAKVYFKKIVAVEANGDTNITCDSLIKTFKIKVTATDKAIVKLNLETKKIKINTQTGSKITLIGKSDFQKVISSSNSFYFGSNFKTNETKIKIQTGGYTDIFTRDVVYIDGKIEGNTTIYGNPKDIQVSVSTCGIAIVK